MLTRPDPTHDLLPHAPRPTCQGTERPQSTITVSCFRSHALAAKIPRAHLSHQDATALGHWTPSPSPRQPIGMRLLERGHPTPRADHLPASTAVAALIGRRRGNDASASQTSHVQTKAHSTSSHCHDTHPHQPLDASLTCAHMRSGRPQQCPLSVVCQSTRLAVSAHPELCVYIRLS
jgi:hypothetical protein